MNGLTILAGAIAADPLICFGYTTDQSCNTGPSGAPTPRETRARPSGHGQPCTPTPAVRSTREGAYTPAPGQVPLPAGATCALKTMGIRSRAPGQAPLHAGERSSEPK